MKFYIDNTTESLLCRMCEVKNETLSHIVNECKILAPNEYKGGMTMYASILTGDYPSSQCYQHHSISMIKAQQPDIVIIDKTKMEVKIIDVARPKEWYLNVKKYYKYHWARLCETFDNRFLSTLTKLVLATKNAQRVK